MMHFKTLKATVCMAALMTGTAASADVTASEVWEDWKGLFGIYGEDGVTIGSETVSGGTVSVNDISFTFDDGQSNITADMGSLELVEQGDGTVLINMSESFPIVVNDEFGSTVNMSVTHSGLSMIASGDPDAINYAITADRYGFQIDSIEENGTVIDGDMRFIANGVIGNYTTTSGDIRNISYDLATTSMDVLVDVTDPDTAGTFLLSGKIDGLGATANVAIPEDANFEQPEDLFADGFAVSGSYSFSSSSYLFDINDNGDAANGTVGTGTGEVAFDLNGSNVAYDVAANDIAASVTSPDFPFPINVSLAQYGVGLQMPLSATDEPADFGLQFNLTDLAVNDEIWMLGDPTNALPHDPATLNFDVTGKAKLFFDLMDPEQAEAMAMTDVPGEIYSLDLNSLKLAIAGALLTGEGGFTFDNSDMSTIPGVPRPEGSVTANLKGANKLIDTLVSMGYLPEDQAMMGRMMMGMFARTVGDDELTSTLEINEQGHVLANGQRIQ